MTVAQLLAGTALIALVFAASKGGAVTVDGEELTDCTNTAGDAADADECDDNEICQIVMPDDKTEATDTKFVCRTQTALLGGVCSAKVACMPGLLCSEGKCIALPDPFYASTTTAVTTLPTDITFGGTLVGPDMTDGEKIYFTPATGKDNQFSCKNANALRPTLTLMDKFFQTVQDYPIDCMPPLLHTWNITVRRPENNKAHISINIEHPSDRVGWAISTARVIPRSHIQCLGNTADMAEMIPTGSSAVQSWLFYGSLFYGEPTTVHCQFAYDLDDELHDADANFKMENFIWVTPVYVSASNAITVASNTGLPPIQLRQDPVNPQFKTLGSLAAQGTKSAVVIPAQNGCHNRDKYKGFEQTLTLPQLVHPDRKDHDILDGDANDYLTAIDLDLAIARATGFGMSLCSYGTKPGEKEITFEYKQDHPRLDCFILYRSENQTGSLAPCHTDVKDSPQAAKPAKDNIYKVKVEPPKGQNVYLYFRSLDGSYGYQLGASGGCSGHQNLRACDDNSTCVYASSNCAPLGIPQQDNKWGVIEGGALTSLLVGVLGGFALNIAREVKTRTDGTSRSKKGDVEDPRKRKKTPA